ncbi:MAG: DUF2125 domain-containing protein [Rhodospirillales bacterium]|nr:MAG: DUF2125 domain-containing protein [Rhodospirillales bacterium]
MPLPNQTMSLASGSSPTRNPPVRRRLRIAAVMTVVIVAVAWVGYGIAIGTLFGRAIDDWIDAHRAEGYAISYAARDDVRRPWGTQTVFHQPVITAPPGAEPWTWQGERAVVALNPLRPDRVNIDLKGGHELIRRGNRPAHVFGQAASLQFLVSQSAARVDGADIALTFQDGHRLTVAALAGSAKPVSTNPGVPAIALTLGAADITVPADWQFPLGPEIAGAEVVATLVGPPPPAATGPAIRAWSAAGGLVEIEKLDLAYGPAILAGSGTFTFDADAQPLAALAVTMQGFLETVNALRDRGLMRREDAFAARFILSALAQAPDDGGPPRLSASLTVQDRELSIGPLVLLRLPAIAWSEPGGGKGVTPAR